VEGQMMKASVTLKEGLRVEAEARGFKVTIDEPTQMGGSNLGMTPTELLLSALGSCMTITISVFSKAFHVDIKDLKVDVEGDWNPAGFMGTDKDVRPGFSAIRFNIHMVTDAPESRVQRLIKTAEEKCPVSDTLRLGTGITGEVNIVTEVTTSQN